MGHGISLPVELDEPAIGRARDMIAREANTPSISAMKSNGRQSAIERLKPYFGQPA